MDLTVAKESELLGNCVVSTSKSSPSLIPVSVVIYSKGAGSKRGQCPLLQPATASAVYVHTLPASARTLSVPTCGMCIILEKPSRKCVISPRLPLPGALASCHARAGLPACMPQLGRLVCSLASVPSTGEICATLLPPSFLPSCAAPGATRPRPPPSDGETQSALCLPRCRLLA